MDNKDIRYAYALNASANLVHISEVTNRNETFKCPGCGIELTPALGEIRKHHFRHGKNGCGFESYLHSAAKITFYNRFIQAKHNKHPLPILLARRINCRSYKADILNKSGLECISIVDAEYDLTKLFDKAQLERCDADTNLVPDVLLTCANLPKQKCYIEIFVTHQCSENKVAQNIPIIEFDVKSEEDIEYIKNGIYNQSSPIITLHHFKVKDRNIDECRESCSEKNRAIALWSISPAGRLSKELCALSQIKQEVLQTRTCWPDVIDEQMERLLIKSMLELKDPENDFPNCFRCKSFLYHSKNRITCKIKDHLVGYDEAKICMHYEVSIDS
ncbi:hypothetical protein [Psychrobium sp. 1_MG-2023]|uniref:hypothetical protein n=1 Tax=Psychrobium sp. 1_MG-2023 TaxID=3062624 RepID=UPI0027368611|nr:hypothetical protein [Psychrobium sp. 1_MG-2023]MDP2560761.1 hypothetical protein [Psychrobium sp. 1_MG-2023]